jgi:HPt (histidine-containing phosphotransfer) domain-containing protein
LFKALLEISSVGASGAGSIEFILPQATERIQKLVSEMSDALDKADFIKVKKLGHDIRGLAATFGLDDIERGSESIERFASDHDELRIRQLLERLLSE